jgi:hypothetical protein
MYARANSLQLEVAGEGVEDRATMQKLKKEQGYFV